MTDRSSNHITCSDGAQWRMWFSSTEELAVVIASRYACAE